jgi:hypothetical protein
MSAGEVALVVLKWAYSPAGFFKVPVSATIDAAELSIDDGKAEARIHATALDPSLSDKLCTFIDACLRAQQVLLHMKFELTGPTTEWLDEAGQVLRREVGLTGLPATIFIGTPEHLRFADQSRFRELSARDGADETLQVMLRAYGAAVRDPADEFIHLYEIRDALKKLFGGERDAIAALGGLTRTSCKTLRVFANVEPVREGRHRGIWGLSLRDATQAELSSARALRRLI